MDYSRRGVRCNTVQAGYILHERRDAGATEEALDARRAQHLTRLAEPLDLAQAVLFFAGPESATITGVTLPVDGGSSEVRGKVLG
jgi:NAD(P)-dependent dehydrogenase (short-subunit alcohol dehydrogenase family)